MGRNLHQFWSSTTTVPRVPVGGSWAIVRVGRFDDAPRDIVRASAEGLSGCHPPAVMQPKKVLIRQTIRGSIGMSMTRRIA
jgi:hypothetical protein